jgi:hypothetical protein
MLQRGRISDAERKLTMDMLIQNLFEEVLRQQADHFRQMIPPLDLQQRGRQLDAICDQITANWLHSIQTSLSPARRPVPRPRTT